MKFHPSIPFHGTHDKVCCTIDSNRGWALVHLVPFSSVHEDPLPLLAEVPVSSSSWDTSILAILSLRSAISTSKWGIRAVLASRSVILRCMVWIEYYQHHQCYIHNENIKISIIEREREDHQYHRTRTKRVSKPNTQPKTRSVSQNEKSIKTKYRTRIASKLNIKLSELTSPLQFSLQSRKLGRGVSLNCGFLAVLLVGFSIVLAWLSILLVAVLASGWDGIVVDVTVSMLGQKKGMHAARGWDEMYGSCENPSTILEGLGECAK